MTKNEKILVRAAKEDCNNLFDLVESHTKQEQVLSALEEICTILENLSKEEEDCDEKNCSDCITANGFCKDKEAEAKKKRIRVKPEVLER